MFCISIVARYVDFNAEDSSTVNPPTILVTSASRDDLFLVEHPNQLVVSGATLEVLLACNTHMQKHAQ